MKCTAHTLAACLALVVMGCGDAEEAAPEAPAASLTRQASAPAERPFDSAPSSKELFELAQATPEGPTDVVFYSRRGETLGHYAKWAQREREAIALRNELPDDAERQLPVGTPITISLSAEDLDRFEQQQRLWHDSYQTAFYTRNTVVELMRYEVRSGDSLWKIARMGDATVPVWLLEKLNPGRDLSVLQVGMRIQVPVVVPTGGAATAAPVTVKATPEPMTAAAPSPPKPTPKKTPQPVAAASPAPSNAKSSGAEPTPIPAITGVAAGLDTPGLTIKVQKGEYLSHYAAWAGISTAEILQANALTNPDLLHVGMTLRLPLSDNRVTSFYEKRRTHLHGKGLPAEEAAQKAQGEWTTHEVLAGETAWDIAVKKLGIPVARVEELNPQVDLNRLRPGMLLRIPVKTATP